MEEGGGGKWVESGDSVDAIICHTCMCGISSTAVTLFIVTCSLALASLTFCSDVMSSLALARAFSVVAEGRVTGRW